MSDLTPVTRTENFLARIAGDDAPELEPITRTEHFLQEIIDNGGGDPITQAEITEIVEDIT
ncbi:MAG: hypothetical protein J6S14_20915 [Clostridia bacterium]|nr:hypothetical protein [Clostridia bacterium]